SESRGAEEKRFTFLISTRVRRVARVLRQALGPERFAGRRDPRNEAAARPNATPQDYPTARYDEDTISRRTALIDRETRRPRRASCIRIERLSLCFTEAREHDVVFQHVHPRFPLRVLGVAMSGPLLTRRVLRSLLRDVFDHPRSCTARSAPV